MTLDTLKFASGRRWQSFALQINGDLSDAKANAAPGSIALNENGRAHISVAAVNDFGDFGYRQIFTLQSNGASALIGSASNTTIPAFTLARGKAAPTIEVVGGDALGRYAFAGRFAPSPSFPQATTCYLQAVVDGTPTDVSYPTSLGVWVTDAGATAPVMRLLLTPSGNLLINNTTGTELLSVTGNIQLTNTADSFKVGTNNVVGSRKTGWAAPTGTATRTTFDTTTVATEQLAERVKALIDDLTSHGLIGV